MKSEIVASDAYGNLVYFVDGNFGMLSRLTPCCGASAKGIEDYVGCRACYAEVEPIYGDAEIVKVGDEADLQRAIKRMLVAV